MTGLIQTLNISDSPYVNAMLSLAAFIIIAKAADLFVDKVIRRFTKFTATDVDDAIIDIVHRPINFTIILAGVVVTTGSLDPGDRPMFYIKALCYTLVALIWTFASIRISNAAIESAVNRVSDATGLGKDVVPLVENVFKIIIFVAGIFVMLSVWKVNITPILASAGIAGAGVAFAAKDTIANFFGGISVFMDRPFKIGDYIVLDQGERGEVVAIGLRSTRIKTRDDIQISVPNSIIANTKIINESAPEPLFRVRIPVSVAYGTDLGRVETLLLDIVSTDEGVVPEPSPRVRFRAFGDSGLAMELLCWARDPSERGLVTHRLNRGIYDRFNAEGVVFPFPQRDLHIHRADEAR